MSYSFTVQTSTENAAPSEEYKFHVDESTGLPRKLGDGTYGSVFEVGSPRGQRAAIKLFYPVSEADATFARNQYEMQSGQRVRARLRKLHREAMESNLVLSSGWTNTFKESEAHRNLEDQFKALGVTVSDQALVMPYYECTLKDLLETGAPPGRLVGTGHREEQGRPGFDILRTFSLQEREQDALVIVQQIATGLVALHFAELYHHDIKPANVMMRSRGGEVEVALGDFGFLEPSPRDGSRGYAAALPLGTRHYRSPEQKDSFDLCDVRVTVDEAERNLVLTTKDKKFRDTLIERGDVAVFSKDGERTGYEVEDVAHGADESTIILQGRKKQESEDDKTQVMLFKKPSPRTDIFGVGAILFELLTMGRSPEAFYDYLRPFDRADADQAASVERIVERYRAATSANSTSADLVPLFSQLRDDVQGLFPSPEIFAVLLRCMLCQAQDSYFGRVTGQGSVNRTGLFEAVLKDVTALLNRQGRMDNRSSIWQGELVDHKASPRAPSFLQHLEEAQAMPQGKRMAWGAMRLRQLIRMINGIRDKDTFLADLSPGNLRVDRNGTEIVAVVNYFAEKEEYLRAVRSGAAWRLEAMGDTDNYVPVYRRFDVPSVELDLAASLDGQEGIWIRPRYTDSLPIWRKTREGDLLRSVDMSGRARIYDLMKIEVGRMQIEEVHMDGEQPTVLETSEIAERKGLLVRRVFPMSYYLSVLATYLHHLFFVDGERDDGTVPDVVWSVIQSGVAANGKLLVGAQRKKPGKGFLGGKSSRVSLKDVKTLLARIYLDLLFISEDRSREHRDGALEMRSRLLGLSDELDAVVARFCGLETASLMRAFAPEDIDGIEVNVPDGVDRPFREYLLDHLDLGAQLKNWRGGSLDDVK